MATIVRAPLDVSGSKPWDAVAECIRSWAVAERVTLRDVTVLLPFVQLLAPARRSFAAAGGWMPRIETTRTLAASLGPPPSRGGGELGWGMANDTLLGMQQLTALPWAAEWSRRDPRGFAQGAARMVANAHELSTAASAVAPEDRAQWWRRARELVPVQGGQAGKEKLLAQIAIEWAARSTAIATDRLFALQPAAWVMVVAGGVDPVAQALLARARVPALQIDTDVDPNDPFRHVPARAPAFHVCDGFEDEAAAAAAQVLQHVDQGATPVVLVAQDRALIRRIRALLERSAVVMRDETGWKLSTTRAGATVMALLEAARRDASSDAWLDWLKAAPIGIAHTAALESIEAALRKHQVVDAYGIVRLPLDATALALRDRALAIVEPLARAPCRSLAEWLAVFAAALDAAGSLARLRDDAAGRQALSALAIDPPLEGTRRAQLSELSEPMSLADFTRWVDDVFDHETFLPPDLVNSEGVPLAVEVVITPLARAMLRPFAAAVLPGADDRRLGAAGARAALLPRSAALDLQLPGALAEREAELLAFAQLLRLPEVTLFRRRIDGADPIGNSAFVDWLRLSLDERELAWRPWRDPRVEQAIAPTPVRRGAPSVAADRLPRRLSASSFQALRDCPYRFFAQGVLGLRAADELDPEVEKRDYGKWLHEVLHAFHKGREPGTDIATDLACLREVGARSISAQGLDEASFLPFSASFDVLVPRYVAWLHERESAGAAWSQGEVDLRVTPDALDGVELQGVLDRIDIVDQGHRLELIDYKTGSASRLKDIVRDRFEDTQLAFYALLVGAQSSLPLRAFYLAMDATHGLEVHEHADVAATAQALLDGLAGDLRRLREGAALPPLGEGAACERCDARGLCRRDHWSPAVEPPGRAHAGRDDRAGV